MKTQLDAPDDIRSQIWKELVRASRDKHHEWRTPVLATTGLDGLAQARTVVLRHAHTATFELDLYTDSRSAKAQELKAQAQAQAARPAAMRPPPRSARHPAAGKILALR